MDVTEAELRAAFLAARKLGQVLQDDVLRAIILAARKVRDDSPRTCDSFCDLRSSVN